MKTKLKIPKQQDSDDNSSKVDKSAPLYMYREGSNYTCGECHFWRDGKCALYGEDVPIKSYGGCNLWMQAADGSKDKEWVNSTTKEESGYIEHKGGFRCGICEYFHDGTCEKVKGRINPDACCNLFELNDE